MKGKLKEQVLKFILYGTSVYILSHILNICFSDFWEVILSFDDELKKKFLLFTTGSDRVPVGGMSEMTFKVTKTNADIGNLPEAHTCFNQLVLPQYTSKEILKEKLTIAISNAEGFGLE